MARVVLAETPSRRGERLARIPPPKDIHGLDLRPVHLRDVAQVRGVWEPVGEDFARAGLNVGHPHGFGVEHLLDCPIEPAEATEQAAESELHHVSLMGYSEDPATIRQRGLAWGLVEGWAAHLTASPMMVKPG